MSETNSSSQQKDVPSNHPDSLRALSWQMLAQKLGDEWNKALDMRNSRNSKITEIDEKAMRLAAEYKRIEDKLDNAEKEILAMDLLDPKVSDLLIAMENGEYEKPPFTHIYDFIRDTDFEALMGEILLRLRQAKQAKRTPECAISTANHH
jgi:hypothetical protein